MEKNLITNYDNMNRYINDKGEFAASSMMIGGRMVSNPTEDMLVKAGYHVYEEPAKTLADYKAEKISEIEAYDASDAVNSFTLGGTDMWLSFDERARIRQSIDAYRGEGKTEMSKWFGGKEFRYSLDEWEAMLNKLSVYASEALNVTESHKAEVNALTDVDAVRNYDVSKGYPDKLSL